MSRVNVSPIQYEWPTRFTKTMRKRVLSEANAAACFWLRGLSLEIIRTSLPHQYYALEVDTKRQVARHHRRVAIVNCQFNRYWEDEVIRLDLRPEDFGMPLSESLLGGSIYDFARPGFEHIPASGFRAMVDAGFDNESIANWRRNLINVYPRLVLAHTALRRGKTKPPVADAFEIPQLPVGAAVVNI